MKSLTEQPVNLIPLDEGIGPDLSVELWIIRFEERDDVHGPTTKKCCALATDTPPPMVARDLVEHEPPATRALVLQAIEELARTSRTRTETELEIVSIT